MEKQIIETDLKSIKFDVTGLDSKLIESIEESDFEFVTDSGIIEGKELSKETYMMTIHTLIAYARALAPISLQKISIEKLGNNSMDLSWRSSVKSKGLLVNIKLDRIKYYGYLGPVLEPTRKWKGEYNGKNLDVDPKLLECMRRIFS